MIINRVLDVSKRINNGRTVSDVFDSVVEEVGELATEVRCKYGTSYKSGADDGILVEGTDIIAAVVDLLYVDNPKLTSADVIRVLNEKLRKWEDAECKYAEKKRHDATKFCIHDWIETDDILITCTQCGVSEADSKWASCCSKEDRDMNGRCITCGQPGY